MKRLVVLVFIVIVAGSAHAEWKGLVGKTAPELGADGWIQPTDATTLEGFRGRPVLLVFFAPSEPGSVAVPRLAELRAIYGGSGLVILGVTYDEEATLEDFAREHRTLFPLAVAGEAAEGWGRGEHPRAYLVAPDGGVTWQGDPSRVPDEVIQKLVKKAKRFHLPEVDAAAEAAANAFRKGNLAEAEALASAAEGEGADLVAARVATFREAWQREFVSARSAGDFEGGASALILLATHFKGTADGEEAAAEGKALAADPKAKKDLAAHKAYARLYTERVRAGGKDRKLKALVKKLERFLDKHDGTRCAAFARRMKDEIEGDPAINEIRAFIARERVDTGSKTWRTRLKPPPQVEFSKSKSYFWNLVTNKGPIRIRFMPDVAPVHVANAIYLTELGFYNGLTFHRVIPGFMAQGGCPKGDGNGNPGYKFAGECSPDVIHDRPGLLSMANPRPDVDGSQFFITFAPARHLDGKHTIFGEVVAGKDTLKKLEAKGSRSGKTSERLETVSASITVE